MKVVAQRVSKASVRVDGQVVGAVGTGFTLLVGIGAEDGPDDLERIVEKCVNLRVFPDQDGRMNRSVLDVGGAILAISQFTLHADCRKGRRPSFIGAAAPEKASPMFDQFVEKLRERSLKVETGIFGAMMEVELINDGPVTIILDSAELKNKRSG